MKYEIKNRWKGGIMGSKVKCLKCGDIIQSTHRHDFRWCSCKSVAVDGGDHYLRIIGDPKDYELVEEERSLAEVENAP